MRLIINRQLDNTSVRATSSLNLDAIISLLVSATWSSHISVSVQSEFIHSFFCFFLYNSCLFLPFSLRLPLLPSHSRLQCWQHSPAAHQYSSRCCMTHAVRTISEAIHQPEDGPLPIPTCLLRLYLQFTSNRLGLIDPINLQASLEEAGL